jgi:hypothetical protein
MLKAFPAARSHRRRNCEPVTDLQCLPRRHPIIYGLLGTWRRACSILDVSEDGARIATEGSIVGLMLKEFFLQLSSPGLAYRRCGLAWVNGEEIGVNFLKMGKKKRRTEPDPHIE